MYHKKSNWTRQPLIITIVNKALFPNCLDTVVTLPYCMFWSLYMWSIILSDFLPFYVLSDTPRLSLYLHLLSYLFHVLQHIHLGILISATVSLATCCFSLSNTQNHKEQLSLQLFHKIYPMTRQPCTPEKIKI